MVHEPDHEHYMRAALAEANRAAGEGEVPIGAVVTRNGAIIAMAHNTRVSSKDPSAHAEISAMREAARKLGDWRLDGCALYTTLEPCAMCAGAIGIARLDEVVFGAYDAKAGCAGSVRNIPCDAALGFSCKVTGGVLAEECAAVISGFMKKLRAGDVKKSSLYIYEDETGAINGQAERRNEPIE